MPQHILFQIYITWVYKFKGVQMDHTKLLIDGSWINRGTTDEPNWELMVFPVVTKIDEQGHVAGSFLLIEEQTLGRVSPWASTLNKLFKENEPSKNVTLHSLGEYFDDEGWCWRLFLTTKIPFIKDNAFGAQVHDGYMFLDHIKPKDTEDDLDMWIYESLRGLTGPRTITFTQETN